MKKLKKLISTLSILSLLLTFTPIQTTKASSEIEINSWQDLANINNDLTANYILTADLDQNSAEYLNLASEEANVGAGWIPIGTYNQPFRGEFNGNNHSISDLYINRPDNDVPVYPIGLFSTTGEDATISNITLSGDVNTTIYGAILVGINEGTITNASAEGIIIGYVGIGGITGINTGLISNSYSDVTVTGSINSGSFAGDNGGTITKSYATGSMMGSGQDHSALGGFVGYNSSEINNSYATGSVTAFDLAGGFVGLNEGGTIINSYSRGDVSLFGNQIGGLVGKNQNQIINSFYNSETSHQNDDTKGLPKTTQQMKDINTFTTELEEASWDFDEIWNINETNNGYPYLYAYEEEPEEEVEEEEEPTVHRLSSSGTKKTIITNQETAELTYQQEIQSAIEKGLANKELASAINKCEALTMISRAFNWKVPASTTSKYTDVPEWCTSVAAYGTTREIVEGRSATTLGMETPVTRYEIALMLYRELKLQNFKFTDFSNVRYIRFAGFEDTLVQWAEEAVNTLHQEGIIKGFPNTDPNNIQTLFKGQESILKQDFAVILLRTIR